MLHLAAVALMVVLWASSLYPLAVVERAYRVIRLKYLTLSESGAGVFMLIAEYVMMSLLLMVLFLISLTFLTTALWWTYTGA